MKTSISKFFSLTAVIIILFTYGSAYGQKSINYTCVGTQVEEITDFLDTSCKKADKVSSEVIDELEMFVKKNTNGETMAKVSEWSEVQLKELNEAVSETKIWLKKQHFAPVKHTKKQEKHLAKKD